MKYKKITHHIFIFLFALIVGFTQVSFAQQLDDMDVENAVSTELLSHSSVPSYLIDVDSNNGIVTLSGSADNILIKQRAEKIAMAVKGVRGVVNNIEVDVPIRSDKALRSDVVDALLYDPATDSYELTVSVDNGVVTINGNVDSWQEKRLAAQVAKSVKGVKKINNEIDFHYDEDRSDYEIKTDIQSALKNDIRVDHALIEANVKNGKVNLDGTVGSATEKQQAKFLSWVAGVNKVDASDLEVKFWARDDNLRKDKYVEKSDEQIEQAVNDALWYDPRVSYFDIEVSVDDGIVDLMGTVDNLKAKQAAKETAKNIVSVLLVNNYIKVRPEIPADEALEEDVRDALLRDPYVDRFEIDVTANNGKVYLYGNVDSYFEKYQAEDVATKVYGVVNVNNKLDVRTDQAYDEDYYHYDYYDWNTFYPSIYTYNYFDETLSDKQIKDNIESQLWWSPFVNEPEVNVSVDNGVATLTGTVDTYSEKKAAAENAFEGGAQVVMNNLEVD